MRFNDNATKVASTQVMKKYQINVPGINDVYHKILIREKRKYSKYKCDKSDRQDLFFLPIISFS